MSSELRNDLVTFVGLILAQLIVAPWMWLFSIVLGAVCVVKVSRWWWERRRDRLDDEREIVHDDEGVASYLEDRADELEVIARDMRERANRLVREELS